MSKSKSATSRLVCANIWSEIRSLSFRCALRRYRYFMTSFHPFWPHIDVDFRKRNKKSWQSLDNKSMESSTWDVNKNCKKFSRNNDHEKNHNSLHDIKIYWKAILGTALDSVLGLSVWHRPVQVQRSLQKFWPKHKIAKPWKIQNENGQVKFDFRYHVIVRSYRPLEAYVMKRFWPKLASEEYDLDVSFFYIFWPRNQIW